jgi:hypothetical protein
MQRHPSPKCKAAPACKAAHARTAGLTHDNVGLWLLKERLVRGENGFMPREGIQCDTATRRLSCFTQGERAVIELRLGVAGQPSARLLLDNCRQWCIKV